MGIDEVLKDISMPEFKEELPEINEEHFFNVVNTRRSVRQYTSEPIPEAVMKKCLRAALLAPNSSNMQPWEFHRVKTPQKKEELAKYCLGQPSATTAAELVVFVARTNTWPQMRNMMIDHLKSRSDTPKSAFKYYEKIIPMAYNQGFLGSLGLVKKITLFAMGLSKPTPRGPASAADMKLWANKTVALACENYMLAMRACGFDTCPMEGFDEVRVHKLLNLPSDASVVMVISAGKRASNGVYGPRIRFDESLFLKEH
jgi:nitroreductase